MTDLEHKGYQLAVHKQNESVKKLHLDTQRFFSKISQIKDKNLIKKYQEKQKRNNNIHSGQHENKQQTKKIEIKKSEKTNIANNARKNIKNKIPRKGSLLDIKI